ncbi:translocation protein S66 [Pichia californica]|uniref:Translocation protein S66 n=1 Tax=Pichia californica TaxID=460514 RepID=A0A9P6WNM8_9ASCO|nr:translocation protein S66 [[Candida] californica]KAG0690459.1 translocation protein S66 [[Candida] californica]
MSEESATSTTFFDTFTETFASATETVTASATASAESDAENIAQPVISISMKTPLLYLGILIITLVLFSIYHRKNKIKSLQKLTSSSLFTSSYDKIDESLINENSFIAPTPTLDSTPALLYNDLKTLKVHEKLLKVALVERAAESLRRIIKQKETEPSIMLLYTRGLIGDESFKRFKLQAKLQDAEMLEIAKEAESFKPGWSRLVFANAQEVMMNQALRRRVNAVSTRKELTEKLDIKGVESVIKDIQKRIVELR